MENKIKKALEKSVKIKRILKNDHRSYVFTFEVEGREYVYKEPIEKNTRKWQRFLAIFRGKESKREYKQMQKINSLGFRTAKPVFYTNSYLVYEFLEGRIPEVSDDKEIGLVRAELKRIHSKGYLHGDSHIDNFIIDREENIYIIDSKFQKNKYGKFGEVFEMMYLEKSLNREITYDKKSIYYRGALLLKKYLIFFSNLKNLIRRR